MGSIQGARPFSSKILKMKRSNAMPGARLYLLLITALFLLFASPAWAGGECKGSGGLEYICGPQNAEDILQLGHSRWLE
jgi:hypothetical protein